jgi:hypothetical protein
MQRYTSCSIMHPRYKNLPVLRFARATTPKSNVPSTSRAVEDCDPAVFGPIATQYFDLWLAIVVAGCNFLFSHSIKQI